MTKDLQRCLGRIEATQALILKELEDLKARTRHLEQKMWTWNGAFAVLVVLWTFFSKYITTAMGFQ